MTLTTEELLDRVIADDAGDIRIFDDPTRLSFVFADIKAGKVVGHLRIRNIIKYKKKVHQAFAKCARRLDGQ